MRVILVDTEHEGVVANPALAPAHRRRVEATRQRLVDAAGASSEVEVVAMAVANPASLAALNPAAIVLGGNRTDWAVFADAALGGILDTIRGTAVPLLGVCAGHQLIGLAHGASWGPLGPLAPGEPDPDPRFAPGQRKERGYLPVRIDAACDLFDGLPASATFFQSHYWQLTAVPSGFAACASSAWSPIQAIRSLDPTRPVFGVQFHAERWDDDHPAGLAVLRNFFAVARHRATTNASPSAHSVPG